MSAISLSVVVPAYNEEKNIGEAVTQIQRWLQQSAIDYEIVVVDDGSKDHTAQIVTKMAAASPGAIRLLCQPDNRGKGAALAAGFSQAGKEWLLLMDADMQIDINELPPFLAQTATADMIIGCRSRRADSWSRRIFSQVYGYLVFLLLGIRCRDLNCPFKLVRRSVIDGVRLRSAGFFIDVELIGTVIAKAGTMVELDVTGRARKHGSSTVRFRHVVETVKELWRFKRCSWSERRISDGE